MSDAPHRPQPQTRSVSASWQTAKDALPWLLFAGTVLGSLTGYIRTDATNAADSRNETERRRGFEVSVDRRLNDAASRFEALDRDRETRQAAVNAKIDSMALVLNGRIDDLNRSIGQRSEKRTAEINELRQDVSDLKLRVCVLGGLRVSQCK